MDCLLIEQPVLQQCMAPPATGLEEFCAATLRLKERLAIFGFSELVVPGDGACQFTSISDQLFRSFHQAEHLRMIAVRQLRLFPEYYVEFIHDSCYNTYCDNMENPFSWGDHVTLQAISDALHLSINLITSYKDQAHIEIHPNDGNTIQTIWLSFQGEIHYNSVRLL